MKRTLDTQPANSLLGAETDAKPLASYLSEVGAIALGGARYRTEHSRSLESAEKYKALEGLKRLGALIPLSEIESYHGRLAYAEAEDWQVDSRFKNGSNDSGNNNVYHNPVLYTSSAEIAGEFAHARGREVYRERLHEALREELRQEGPRAYRQAKIAERIQFAEDFAVTLTPESRRHFLDPESKETTYYKQSEDEAKRRQGWSFIQQDARDLLLERQKIGAMPAASDEPWSERELRRAAWDRADMLTDEERQEYARVLAHDLRAAIHDITSSDSDAVVINRAFRLDDLSEDDQEVYRKHVATLARALSLTEGAPLGFTHEDDAHINDAARQIGGFIKEHLKNGEWPWVRVGDVDTIVAQTGAIADDVRKIAAANNAQWTLYQSLFEAVRIRRDATEDIVLRGENKDIPVSREYIERIFREMHIVGTTGVVDSSTVGKTINIAGLFDLEKVNPSGIFDARREHVTRSLLPTARVLDDRLSKSEHSVVQVAREAYAKPRTVLAAVAEVAGFKEILRASAGNWEGYTLEDHTESVLRNFEENYADKVPVELLAPMRLAIVVHDLGKPDAVVAGEKHRQSVYNQVRAEEFLGIVGVDTTTREFLRGLIGQGMELAAPSAIFGRDANLPRLRSFAAVELKKLIGGEVTDVMIDGYLEMCEMLVTCDGGSYTNMAVSRRTGSRVIRRHAQSFDASFLGPAGPGGRDLQLKHAGIARRSRDM